MQRIANLSNSVNKTHPRCMKYTVEGRPFNIFMGSVENFRKVRPLPYLSITDKTTLLQARKARKNIIWLNNSHVAESFYEKLIVAELHICIDKSLNLDPILSHSHFDWSQYYPSIYVYVSPVISSGACISSPPTPSTGLARYVNSLVRRLFD